MMCRKWITNSLSTEDKEKIKALITKHHQKNHPVENVSYYHNMFCAAIVHPDNKIALTLAPEPPYENRWRSTKNDC